MRVVLFPAPLITPLRAVPVLDKERNVDNIPVVAGGALTRLRLGRHVPAGNDAAGR